MKSTRAMAYCSQRASGHKITRMRPAAFGEALSSGTRLTLFCGDKPDRFFTVTKFWMDETSGGRIRQALIRSLFLMARWLGNREAGVMEQWSIGHARIATRSVASGSVGLLRFSE